MDVPEIDLHPEVVPGNGPDAAVMLCREFVDNCLKAGFREIRIITGGGKRGTGEPRLRSHIEKRVLAGYFSQIEYTGYEQSGAVIRVRFFPQKMPSTSAYKRKQTAQMEKQRDKKKKERLLISINRLELAKKYVRENNIRLARIKLNQIFNEYGLERLDKMAEVEEINKRIDEMEKKLRG